MNDFEKYTTQMLQNYPSPVDSERLWQNIDLQLRPRRSRPMLWLGLLLLGGALAAGGAFLFFQFEKKTAPVAAAQQLGAPSAGSFFEKTAAENVVGGDANNGTLADANNGTLANANNGTLANASNGTLADASNGSLADASNGSTERAGVSENAVKPLKIKNLSQKNEAMSGASGGMDLISNRRGEQGEGKKVFQKNVAGGDANNGLNSTEVLYPDFAKSGYERAAMARLPLRTPPLLDSENRFSVKFSTPCDPDTPCPRWKKGTPVRPYFGVYGGAQWPLKTLETKDLEYDGIAARREETETVLEAVSVGGYAGLQFTRRLGVEAGLEYHRLNERFDWSESRTDTFGKIAVIGIIVNAPGDTTRFQDTVHLVRTTETVKKTFNHYQFVNLPVAATFTLNPGGRLETYLKAGVMVNLSFRQKAEIIGLEGAPVLYKSGEGDAAAHPFRSKIGIAPFATLGARYRLGGGLSLFGELRYLHHTTELTTEKYPIRQRYGFAGANVGVQLGF